MVWIEVNGGNSAEALKVKVKPVVTRVVNLSDDLWASTFVSLKSIISPRAFGA